MPDLIFSNRGAAEAIRLQEKLNEEAADLKAIYDADTKSAEKLRKSAQAIYEATKGPQEKMLQRIAKIQKAQKEGLIPPKQAEQAIDQLKKKMDELGDEADDAGGQFNSAFAITAVGSIGSAIASALSFKEVLAEVNQLLDEQAQKRVESSVGLGSLVQLAGADASKRDTLVAAAEQTFLEGSFRELNEAANLVYQLESAGALKDRGFFSSLQVIDDAAILAKNTALIRNNLGEAETGSLRALTSKSLAGALPATGVSAADIARGSAAAAQSAKKLGLSDEELIAAVSRVAESTGSADLAGTQVNSLLASLIKEGFADDPALRGKNFSQLLDTVTAKDLSEEDLISFFGRQEAAKAFGVLQDSRAYGARVREIYAAEKGDLAGSTIRNALEDDRIAVRRLALSSAARKELALANPAVGQAGNAAVNNRFFAERLEEGSTVEAATFAQIIESFIEFFTGSANREAGQKELDRFQEAQLELLKQSNKTQAEQKELTKETNRKLEGAGLTAGAD